MKNPVVPKPKQAPKPKLATKSKHKTTTPQSSDQGAGHRGSGLARCWSLLKRLRSWLLAAWRRPRDPVLRSLRLVKRYGGSGTVPEQQWRQLEQQARSLAKRDQRQQALTVLHCLWLLKPGSTGVQSQVEELTARQHKLSLNSKENSGSTRAYRKQQLDFYVQQRAVQVLEAVSQL
jgi:hypothetical protein